jgi:hypothetical protein
MSRRALGTMMLSFFVIAVTLAAFPASSHADELLTFDELAPFTVVTSQYAGVNFAGAAVLTVGLDLDPHFPPASGLNVLYNTVGALSLVFSSPVSYFQGAFTYNSGLTLQGFDALNNPLATTIGAFSANYIGSGNAPNEVLSVTAANIRKVVVTGGAGNNFTLDNAQFTGSTVNSAVPEPSELTLLGAGLAMLGLAAFSTRRRAQAAA